MKKTLRLLALLMLVVTMCFAVVSCDGDGTPENTSENTPENTVINNDFGAKLEGGGFDAGTVLNTEPFAADSAERANAIEKIVEYGVPLEQKAVAVYDIDATKDGVEVQPNGSVRVTIPAPIAAITSYDVFHISDNGSVDILNAVTADGKITFESSSFSTFLVASKVNVGDDVFANAPSYVAPYQTMKLGNATVNVNSMYQHYGNFKVGNASGEYFTYQTYANAGDKITLTAIPNEGYEFVRWSKDGVTVSENASFEYTVTEGSNQLYAQFVSTTTYFIEVVNEGYNYFYGMNSINDGIAYGTVSEHVDIGEQVTLRFTPAEGYYFAGLYTTLSDDPITTATEYTFTATESVKFWAVYKPVNDCTLTIENAGYTYGMGDNYIDDYTFYGSTSKDLKTGDVVTLRFVARPGYRFVGVYNSEDPDTIITTETEYTYTVTGTAKLYAIYEAVPAYSMIVSTVNINSWQFMGTATYAYGKLSGSYMYGDVYEGTEVALDFDLYDENVYRFLGWYDGYNIEEANLLSTEREYTFTMNGDKKIYAHFEEVPDYIITIERFGGQLNSALIHMDYASNSKYIQGEYRPGTEVTLDIDIKDDRYKFLGWYDSYGVLVSENETYTFTPDGDTYLFASVVEKSSINVTVGVNSNFEGSFVGETTGKMETYCTFKIYEGKNELVSAYANKGYKFVGWYVDEECVSTEATIDLSTFADGTYVQATFEIKENEVGTVTGMWVLGENIKFNQNIGWHFEGDFESRTFTATITAGDENVSDINELYLQCVRFGINGEKLLQPHYELDIDLGNYDPNVVGVYEVYLTYREDPSIVLTLIINVDSNEYYDVQVIARGGAGSVTIVDVVGTSANVKSGTELTFTQTPLSDRIFGGWYYLNSDNSLGEFITYDDECTVKITSDVKIGAHYYSTDDSFTVNATAQGDRGYIVIKGKVQNTYTAEAMETVTIAAVANYGYRFVGWYVDGELVSTNATYEYLATADLDIEARFEGEWILFGAYIDEDGYTGYGNPQNQFLVVRTSPHTGERETIAVDHDRVFSLQYGDVVEFIAKPMEGYTFGAFRFDETNGEFFGHDGYYKWTVDITEDNSIIQAFFQPVSASEENINLYVDFEGSMCDDCYVYINGIKMTKANSQAITVKDQSKVSFVAIECGECEGFRYYIHTNGSQPGTVITDGVYSFIVTTDMCKQVTTNFGTEYTLYFDACFGFETVTLGMFHDEDVVDVVVENAYDSSTGEHVTLENTLDYIFGAVYGETIRLKVEVPEDWTAYTFTIEITVTYSNLDADNKVIKTYYIHSDDLDGDYYDLFIEYPGYYEIDVSAGKVVN